MRTAVIFLGKDIATSFGMASGPCICPPEIDVQVHSLAVAQVFEKDDDFGLFGWNDDDAKDVLDQAGYNASGFEFEYDDNDWTLVTRDDPFVDVAKRHGLAMLPTDKGAIVRAMTATEIEPCGRRGGVYDHIRF